MANVPWLPEGYSEEQRGDDDPVCVTFFTMNEREIAIRHNSVLCKDTTVGISALLFEGTIVIVANCERCGRCHIVDVKPEPE